MVVAAALALCASFCSRSAAFWRGVSGPAEERLLHLMSYGMMGCMLATAVPIYFFGIPYGRYSSRAFGVPIPASVAWTVQEAPAFLVPCLLLLCSDSARLSLWTNRILLGPFLFHYAYRFAGLGGGGQAGTEERLSLRCRRSWPPHLR